MNPLGYVVYRPSFPRGARGISLQRKGHSNPHTHVPKSYCMRTFSQRNLDSGYICYILGDCLTTVNNECYVCL